MKALLFLHVTMSVERALEGWEEVQRQGQDIADRFGALAQGIGCVLQSHMRFSGIPVILPFHPTEPAWDRQWCEEALTSLSTWPWPWVFRPSRRTKARVNRVGMRRARPSNEDGTMHEKLGADDSTAGIQEVGHHLGQVGVALGACIGGFMQHAMSHISWPFHVESVPEAISEFVQPQSPISMEYRGGQMDWVAAEEPQSKGGVLMSRYLNQSGSFTAEEEDLEEASDLDEDFEDAIDAQDASNEEFLAVLSKPHRHLHRQQSSISVTTTFDSRTQEVESSFVARGELWRAEASHGGSTSGSQSSPLFLLQIGPILFVRDTTLLLPVHLSKQHLLWYGFDRKNGVHSLCPAIWSKHRRWLLMSMICLNPFTCSFLDFQFPNGQFTYIAGEGLSTGAFFPAFGGLFQAQSRYPGDTKVSFSKKVGWGTRITPVMQLPEKSLSFDIVQQLSWKRSGAMVRPMIELSITPTIGGRNAGWRAELIHFPKEKLSVACGFAWTIQPTAFVSISVGRSKRNGSHSGNSGLDFQVETPIDNINRVSFSIQLNSGVDF